MPSDSRIHSRTPMKCQVKVMHPAIGEILVNTRDISEGGVFLLTEHLEIAMPPIGTILTGQVQGMPVEAPILQMEIVRTEPAGIGLRFVMA